MLFRSSYTSSHKNNQNEIESNGLSGNTVTINPLQGNSCVPSSGTPDGGGNDTPDSGNNAIPDNSSNDIPDSGSSGSSGCSLKPGAAFDPLLPFMLLFAVIYLLNGYRYLNRNKVRF